MSVLRLMLKGCGNTLGLCGGRPTRSIVTPRQNMTL